MSVLAAIGINRFVLAGLSAAVPLTVPEPSLYTANAIAPTASTMAAAVAAFLGSDSGRPSAAATPGRWWSCASPRGLCGGWTAGDPRQTRPVRSVARRARAVGAAGGPGLADGATQLWHRHPARNAIVMVSAQRIAIGAGTIIAVLLLRLHINPPETDRALNELALMLAAAAAGALLGAVLTPYMSRLIGPIRWTSISFLIAGVVSWWAVATASVISLIFAGLVIGFAGQVAKVCGDTLVQEGSMRVTAGGCSPSTTWRSTWPWYPGWCSWRGWTPG